MTEGEVAEGEIIDAEDEYDSARYWLSLRGKLGYITIEIGVRRPGDVMNPLLTGLLDELVMEDRTEFATSHSPIRDHGRKSDTNNGENLACQAYSDEKNAQLIGDARLPE